MGYQSGTHGLGILSNGLVPYGKVTLSSGQVRLDQRSSRIWLIKVNNIDRHDLIGRRVVPSVPTGTFA